MLDKLTGTTGGKIGIALFIILAVGLAIFSAMHFSSGDDNRTANEADVKAAAQKQIDQINSNANLPPALKQEMLNRQQGLLQGGGGQRPPSGPPTAGS